MEILILLVIVAMIFGFIGMAIGDLGGKNNGPAGFLLGALLGPLGCLIAAVLPPGGGADKAPQPATDDTKKKIAELEAKLADLKKAQPAAKKALVNPDDDGGIPTYRLD